jgi:hypothetical protein
VIRRVTLRDVSDLVREHAPDLASFRAATARAPSRHVLGDGAAGTVSGRWRRSRALAAVTSTPYSRITAEM